MDYLVYTYGGEQAVYRFGALADAAAYCSIELMPAKPCDVEIGLRFEAEIGSDGGVRQMTLMRRQNNLDWWDRYFTNPRNIDSIVIQRVDVANAADAASAVEGNRIPPRPTGYSA